MATVGQQVFQGGDVVIHCNGDWSCCQREQAKAKVDGYNEEIKNPKAPGSLQMADSVGDLEGTKSIAQKAGWADFNAEMSAAKNKKDRLAVAKKHSTSDCLAEEVADKWDPAKPGAIPGTNMDHTIESIWGGAANVDLGFGGPSTFKILDDKVNTSFGGRTKSSSVKLKEKKEDAIKTVSLVCPPPCKPPKKGDEKKDYSTGDHQKRPYMPGKTEVRPRSSSTFSTTS